MLRVGGDDVDRAPHGGQLRVVRRLVEVVAAVPPALGEGGIELARALRARELDGAGPLDGHASRAPPRSRRRRTRRPRSPRRPATACAGSPPRRTSGSPTAGGRRRACCGTPRRRRRRSRTTSIAKRRSARQRDDLERRARDDPERALGADEELRQVRADGVARHRDGVDQLAARAARPAATARGPRSCRSGSRAPRSRARRRSRRPSPTRPRPGSGGASARAR